MVLLFEMKVEIIIYVLAIVKFEGRQNLIKRLIKYQRNMINLFLDHEPLNKFNPYYIKIIVSVIGKGTAPIGYVSKELALIFNKNIKVGKNIVVSLEDISGSDN